ncbi:MAG: MBL fold metallo-hydrolase [Desulfobacterales bacterium]
MNIYPLKWTANTWILGINEFPSFLVTGQSNAVLIEAGVSSLAPKILQDLNTSCPAARLTHLFAAHAHADHVCGLIRLKNTHPHLHLCGSRDTGRILEKSDIMKNFVKEDHRYTQYLSTLGVPVETDIRLAANPVSLDEFFENQGMYNLGGVSIETVAVPGHAPGGTGFLIKPDNVLLISDSAGYANTADDILPLFFHNFRRSIETLEKLQSFQAAHLGLGHNVYIDGHRNTTQFFDRAISCMHRLKADILEKMQRSSSRRVESDLADAMHRYGLFRSFSHEKLIRLAQLLIRRAAEKNA